jgi:hypothetical protein
MDRGDGQRGWTEGSRTVEVGGKRIVMSGVQDGLIKAESRSQPWPAGTRTSTRGLAA